jgi:hypothetical protein
MLACEIEHLHAVQAGNVVSPSEEYCIAKIESIRVRRDQGYPATVIIGLLSNLKPSFLG